MEIYLIRHTRVEVAFGTCYGQADVPLADSFAREANAIENQLPASFDAVFSSPSTRCLQLAQTLSPHTIQQDKRLMEMHFGDWEMKQWDDIPLRESKPWMDDFVTVQTPSGESLNMLYDRVCNFIQDTLKQDLQQILICTHAGVIRCFWAYVLDIPLKNIFKIPVEFGSITALRIEQDPDYNAIVKVANIAV